MWRAPLLALAGLALALSACGDDGASSGGDRLSVVATTTQTADLVAAVGGDRVDVEGLLTANADPHDYEPRPSDAEAIARAPLVVRSGGDLDEWLGDLVDSAGSDPEVLTLIHRVETIEDDPHWWHDPRNAVLAVAAIRDALAGADPEGRATYEANARAYTQRVERLDAAVAACMGAIPAERRKLVTTHDSLGSFAARYDVEVIGSVLDSLSTQAQPSAGDTQELIDQMRAERVRVVFAESSVEPRLERAIADEAGARVGGELWADTLGPPGSGAETYLGSVAANASALARGFGGPVCELPAT